MIHKDRQQCVRVGRAKAYCTKLLSTISPGLMDGSKIENGRCKGERNMVYSSVDNSRVDVKTLEYQ